MKPLILEEPSKPSRKRLDTFLPKIVAAPPHRFLLRVETTTVVAVVNTGIKT